MDLLEFNTHSFIVKVWLEETAEEAGHAVWRGHITHVPSGERRYFKDLDEIQVFIVRYLEAMGIRLRKGACLWQCLERLRTYLVHKLWIRGRGGD